MSPEKLLNMGEGLREGPDGGIDKPTDKDQRVWVFLNNPKKYFANDKKT